MSRRHCTAVIRLLAESGEVTIEGLPADRRRRLYRLVAFVAQPVKRPDSRRLPHGSPKHEPVDKRLRAEWEAIARRASPAPFKLSERLKALAELLPVELPQRSRWQLQLLGLEGGELEQVEAELARIEHELLDELAAQLDKVERAQLHQQVAQAFQPLSSRLAAEELVRQQELLLARKLRKRFELPQLSLFARELEGGSAR